MCQPYSRDTEDCLKQLLCCISKAYFGVQAEHDAFEVDEEDKLDNLLETMQNAAKVREELQQLVHHYKHAVPFLQPGRIVKLKSHISGNFPIQFWKRCLSLFEKACATLMTRCWTC